MLAASPLEAYVGPGAGFAFVGSLLSLLAAFLAGAAGVPAAALPAGLESAARRAGLPQGKGFGN